MPPLIKHTRHESDEVLAIHAPAKDQQQEESSTGPAAEFKPEIVWRNVAIMGYLHAAAAYGLYLSFTSAMIKTSILGQYLLLMMLLLILLTMIRVNTNTYRPSLLLSPS